MFFSGIDEISDGHQKDITHFLRLLLQTLELELSSQPLECSSFIQQFWGKEKTIRRFLHTQDGACDKCHNFPRIEEEMFNILKLNLVEHVDQISLDSLISNYFSESLETIEMKCSSCCPHKHNCPQTGVCKLRKAVNQKVLARSPAILLIQLSRFQNFSNLKVKTKVLSSNQITMPNQQKYELLSIADHIGTVIENGHYVASVKYGETWYRCNDEAVHNLEEQYINTEENYIFVYKKITGPIIPSFIPTSDWQEIIPGQAIPGGCEASLDMSGTGKTFARMLKNGKEGLLNKHNNGSKRKINGEQFIKEDHSNRDTNENI